MNLGEEETTGIPFEIRLCGVGETQEKVKQEPNWSGPLVDLLKDPSMQKGQELGDSRQDSDSSLLHTFQQIGRFQALQEGDPGSAEEGEKKCDHEGVHMVEREDGQ
jgi:hypothetical protein